METQPDTSPTGNCQANDYWNDEGQLKALLDALPVLIAYVNNDRHYCFNNLTHRQWFGYTPQEISGMPMWQVLGIEAYETLRPHIKQALNGDQVMFELLVPYQRIGPRFICATYVPDRCKDGRIRGFFSLISDISEIRHAEDDRNRHLKEAAHTARLNSMSELASQIIHEVGQPLVAIISYSEACSRLLASGNYDLGELVASLDDIGKQAERAGKIIRKIRNFISKHEVRFVDTDINGLIRESLRLMELDLNWRATQFHLDTDVSELRVRIDPVMIERVILNLLQNALKTMEEQPPEQRRLTLRTRRNTDGEVEVTVENEGPELSTDEINQLFLPFTSTKPSGMGMGLVNSRSIIMEHGGRLWATTNPEGGASFRFTLPQYNDTTDYPAP